MKGGLVGAGVKVQHSKFKEEIEKGKELNQYQTKARIGAAFTHAFLLAVEKIQTDEIVRDDGRLSSHDLDLETEALAKKLYTIVHVSDRKYRLTTYKRCFTGKRAVKAIIEHKLAPDRESACKLAQSLLDKGVFHHVLGEHDFKVIFFLFKNKLLGLDEKMQSPIIINILLTAYQQFCCPKSFLRNKDYDNPKEKN